ncbi:MAG: UDP-N-acetylglucosamine diphosphorylase/glucosamine-1-phosphate N-acetyltransferase [Gammaproteobacteria bacterium]|nr:UDP-N-acetylglucosamine diphosphorylase/glucosamine-1-phosphate N-acetyltransferase [Gammaproteobacteria bacterium]
MKLTTVILAAGQGTRMQSDRPKVLHELGGKPLLRHVVDAAQRLSPQAIYVIYHHEKRALVRDALPDLPVTWINQTETLGTAHAVQQALPMIDEDQRVLILYGDVPLISAATLQKLLATPADTIAWLTAVVDDPSGLGRIIRDNAQRAMAIVEERDLAPEQQAINEINSGIALIPAQQLKKWLPTIDNHNSQQELYLTDLFALAVNAGHAVTTVTPEQPWEVLGVNSRAQLAKLERCYQRHIATQLLNQGVTLLDPDRFDLRGELQCGCDVTLDINVILEGKVSLGNRVTIGANVYLRDVEVGDNVTIRANSFIEQAVIEADCRVGPLARIRPQTHLKRGSIVGNFAEINRSTIGEKSKIHHHCYIGDTEMGSSVNIAAGTVVCNYDGVNKHPTTIGDGASTGGNCNLVAPVVVGDHSMIAAGSTITKPVPAEKLAVARSRQITIDKWKRPEKKSECKKDY